jgi:CheY-like chemotaxis protein
MASKKILVVDDEAVIRKTLEHFLSKDGYSVYTAATVEEALEILGQESIPVMFVDLGLEVMSRFELSEKIREENPDAIIYALIGYATLFDPEKFGKADFDDWFSKPVDIMSIRQALRNAFAKITRKNVIKRVLIIDYGEQFREVLREMLEFKGFTVLEACDGEEALLCQSVQPADLIIIDVIIAGKDGVDTMLEIQEVFPETKFIVITSKTGYQTDAKLDLAQIFGACILRKPFRREQILETIEQLQNDI